MPRIEKPWRPTREQLAAAEGKTLRDLIGPGLAVLFCGINPGLYTAAVGHHFARPGNRFWPALRASGFTDRLYSPFEEELLLPIGLGITNVVERATASADVLTPEELIEGGKRLRAKIEQHAPRYIAFLGIGAYRTAFGVKDAAVGESVERIGRSGVWILPNPSGLNAHYQPADLARLFAQLRNAAFH